MRRRPPPCRSQCDDAVYTILNGTQRAERRVRPLSLATSSVVHITLRPVCMYCKVVALDVLALALARAVISENIAKCTAQLVFGIYVSYSYNYS